MAVVSNSKDTVIVVNFQTGLNPQGVPVLRLRSFPNVKASATDQDVYDVATALYGLQDYPLIGVRRDNRFDLTEA